MSRSILIWVVLAALSISVSVSAQRYKISGTDKRSAKTDTVRFGAVEAVSEGKGVLVRWTTTFERDNLGFRVVRWNDGRWEKLGFNLTPGNLFSSDPKETYGRDYSFFDPSGDYSSKYAVIATDLFGRVVSSKEFYPQYSSAFGKSGSASLSAMKEAAVAATPVTITRNPLAPKGLTGTSAALPPNPANQFWVASQPGVKIGVKQDGFYRVSRTELENAGFDVNSDPDLWQLYLDGNEQSIVVGPNGDYIEFFGRSIDTPSTDTNVYFLVVGNSAGSRIAGVTRTPTGAGMANSYAYEFLRKDRSLYATSVLNGPAENYFGAVIRSSAPTDETFDIDSIDYNYLKTTVQIGIQGFTSTQHKVNVKINGVNFGSVAFSAGSYVVADVGIPTQILVNGTNTVSLQAETTGVDLTLFASVKVKYFRQYVATNEELYFGVPDSQGAVVSGFNDSSIRVFDVTAPDSPVLVENAAVNGFRKFAASPSVTIPANSAAFMFAVSDTGLRTVDYVAPNVPSTLSSTANAAEMVIVSYKDWITEAGQWATYRQNSGVDTVAVNVEDVYDEFGYGKRSSGAIKDFINYAVSNWSTGPGYVLLLGDASYDPKNYLGFGDFDFVPTEMFDTSYEETGSDEALGDFDLDGLSNVAIGRISARTPAQVSNALAKVTAFEGSLANVFDRGSLCASDLFDLIDFEALCSRVVGELPASIPNVSVNRGDMGAKTTMIAAMNQGQYLVNYSGHGGSTFWAAGNFFALADASSLTNTDLTIFTMLTCENGYFIEPNRDSLSERLMSNTGKGAVAAWGSSGKTTPDVQEVLARRFYSKLGNDPALDRIGDLVMDAKTVIVGGNDVKLSWVLFGDPAMKVK